MKTVFEFLSPWIQQPTTVAGFAAVLGTISSVLMKQINWLQAVPLLVAAATSMLLPDSARANSAVASLAHDPSTPIVKP